MPVSPAPRRRACPSLVPSNGHVHPRHSGMDIVALCPSPDARSGHVRTNLAPETSMSIWAVAEHACPSPARKNGHVRKWHPRTDGHVHVGLGKMGMSVRAGAERACPPRRPWTYAGRPASRPRPQPARVQTTPPVVPRPDHAATTRHPSRHRAAPPATGRPAPPPTPTPPLRNMITGRDSGTGQYPVNGVTGWPRVVATGNYIQLRNPFRSCS